MARMHRRPRVRPTLLVRPSDPQARTPNACTRRTTCGRWTSGPYPDERRRTVSSPTVLDDHSRPLLRDEKGQTVQDHLTSPLGIPTPSCQRLSLAHPFTPLLWIGSSHSGNASTGLSRSSSRGASTPTSTLSSLYNHGADSGAGYAWSVYHQPSVLPSRAADHRTTAMAVDVNGRTPSWAGPLRVGKASRQGSEAHLHRWTVPIATVLNQ